MCARTFLEHPLGSDGGGVYRPAIRDKILFTDPDRAKWTPWWAGYEFEDKIGEPVYSVDWSIGAYATPHSLLSLSLSLSLSRARARAEGTHG
jgi:hypothetical protein